MHDLSLTIQSVRTVWINRKLQKPGRSVWAAAAAVGSKVYAEHEFDVGLDRKVCLDRSRKKSASQASAQQAWKKGS
jgi:hypothetical protein